MVRLSVLPLLPRLDVSILNTVTQARLSTLLCATHDGLDASLAAYAELATLVCNSAPADAVRTPSSPPRSAVLVSVTDANAQRAEVFHHASTLSPALTKRTEYSLSLSLSTHPHTHRSLSPKSHTVFTTC